MLLVLSKDAVRYLGTLQLVHVYLVYRTAKCCMVDAVALVRCCISKRGSAVMPEEDVSTMVRSDATSVRSEEAVLSCILTGCYSPRHKSDEALPCVFKAKS